MQGNHESNNYRRQNQSRNQSRNRRRPKKNRQRSDENREDVTGLLYIARDGFGFLRSAKNAFSSHHDDVFVPQHFISRFKLRPGVKIDGHAVRRNNRRPLTMITKVDGEHPGEFSKLREFNRIIVEDPRRRIHLETLDGDMSLRIIDLVTPIGFGQRALIVAPPRTGKTVILQKMANAISTNHPDVEVIVMLVDERPEEVTDFTRSCKGAKVLSSSLDMDTSAHVDLCEMVHEYCRRQFEHGRDVVLLIDSLTRLARAFNTERGKSGRTLSGGLDAQAMQKPREIFGSARCGTRGSLTIIATALVDTGSRMDQVIFEEFKGTGNMELVLRRDLADSRLFPAINVRDSGTRKEEKLRTHDEYNRATAVRRMLLKGKPKGALQGLMRQMQRTRTNAEFLMGLPI